MDNKRFDFREFVLICIILGLIVGWSLDHRKRKQDLERLEYLELADHDPLVRQTRTAALSVISTKIENTTALLYAFTDPDPETHDIASKALAFHREQVLEHVASIVDKATREQGGD